MTQHEDSGTLEFKFRMIVNGRAHGPTWKGVADESGLSLADARIDYLKILGVVRLEPRLLLGVTEFSSRGSRIAKYFPSDTFEFVLGVLGSKAVELKTRIDRVVSAWAANQEREDLEASGLGADFRTATCPVCRASIRLSGLPLARYVYCPYCGTVAQDQQVITSGREYGICGNCGFFGSLRKCKEWYFFFAIFIWFYQSKRHYICKSCRSTLRWGMFLGSLAGVVGLLPYLIWRLAAMEMPSLTQRAIRRGGQLARKGKATRLARIYRPLYMQWPDHPGLLFNEMKACQQAGDTQTAEANRAQLLKFCPNFGPAISVIDNRNFLPPSSQVMHAAGW